METITVIEPRTSSVAACFSEAWRSRAMVGFLALQFLKGLYRNTRLGALWLLIRPLIPAFVTALVFGRIAKIESGSLPYVIFIFSGMSVWNIFANSLRILTRSLKIGRSLIRNLYFPRVLVPVASSVFFLIEFSIYTVFLIFFIAYYGITTGTVYLKVGPGLLAAPLYLLTTVMLTLGIGFVTSILNTRARDVRFSVPYGVNLVFFLTPVIYPLSLVPERWHTLVLLNPLAVAIDGYRWSLFGAGEFRPWALLYALVTSGAVFLLGLRFFLKMESSLSDQL